MSSLYVHIPFCEHKCVYCDFYSIAPREEPERYHTLIARFIAALLGEIRLRGGDERFRKTYESVFFGGGTPSLLSPSNIAAILDALAHWFDIQAGAEITLETNPGTVDREKLKAFRMAGVNRLSIGVQSFHDDDLRFLSRIHTAHAARECVRDAFDAGFENVGIDLMFSLPSQTRERWRSNLEQAVELGPTHISCYSLIVEPNTPLFRMVQSRQVTVLSVEEDAALYEETMGYLSAHGFEQYEVSNFARPGFRSRHNCNYWNHSNYLGFGPSAHSFWDSRDGAEGAHRWWNIANVSAYAECLARGTLPVAGEEFLSDAQLVEEGVFLGLRSSGVDVAGFRSRFRKDLLADRRSTVDALVEQRLAVLENGVLRLTPKGYLVCDEICAWLS